MTTDQDRLSGIEALARDGLAHITRQEANQNCPDDLCIDCSHATQAMAEFFFTYGGDLAQAVLYLSARNKVLERLNEEQQKAVTGYATALQDRWHDIQARDAEITRLKREVNRYNHHAREHGHCNQPDPYPEVEIDTTSN